MLAYVAVAPSHGNLLSEGRPYRCAKRPINGEQMQTCQSAAAVIMRCWEDWPASRESSMQSLMRSRLVGTLMFGAAALQAGQAARRARERSGGSASSGVHADCTVAVAGTSAAVTAGDTGSRGSRRTRPSPARTAVYHVCGGLSGV